MKIILFYKILLVLTMGLTFNNLSYTQSIKKGSFAAISLQGTSVNKGFGVVVGFSAGYKNNTGVIIGLELYDLLNGPPFPDQQEVLPENFRRSKMHMGGINLGYELPSQKETRLRISTLVGLGDISAYTVKKKDSQDNSVYFVAMPKISMSFQSLGNVRMYLDAGYRLPYGVNTNGTGDKLLRGFFLGIAGVYGK